ncbi:MAG: ergothioneine biosynthesis protein EgtB [Chromatiales bacterium]|nr:ergothioneine biosynthesis protein EgtB [Chromatiales bacterium]
MKYTELVESLSQLQNTVQCLTASVEDIDYRRQYHPDLSPLGWHYGHIVYTEILWLWDTLLGAGILKESDHQLYNPRNTPKPLRGKALSHRDITLEQGQQQFNDNIALLGDPPQTLVKHRLMRDSYLLKFILQHHAMHLETMKMVMTQRCLQGAPSNCDDDGLNEATEISKYPLLFADKSYRIGGVDNWSFDNELPQHTIKLNAFAINHKPVSNAEYLGFMESGGYHEQRYWSPEGYAWLKKTKATAPDGWHYQDGWFQATPAGYKSLDADSAVYGLCYYEAQACARYAGARLPHEYEREAAHPQIDQPTEVWEWCLNNFHPYPNYKDFPYTEYSTPWFNGHHYVLRGGCSHNKADYHLRPSFRNFYEKDKRHTFAGLRLAYDCE